MTASLQAVTGPTDPAAVTAHLHRLCHPQATRAQAAAAVDAITADLTRRVRQLPATPVVVPVLRAGAAMLHASRDVLGHPPVAFARAAKDKAGRAVRVWWNTAHRVPPNSCIVLDVVVARGDTIAAVLRHLRDAGYQGTAHVIACYAAPEGVEHILDTDPSARLYVGAYAHHVDPQGYVQPPTGGDIGTKLYGTHDVY